MSRHKARETAMQITFQVDFGKNSLDMAKLTLKQAGLKPDFADFAWSLVLGIEENKELLNEYLVKFTKEWSLERLANVDKCILRLAMYELMFQTNTPPRIVISEGVELAKSFGGAEAPSFINAVLDGFYHKVVLEDQPGFRPDETLKASIAAKAATEAEALSIIQSGQAVLAPVPVPEPVASKPEDKPVKAKVSAVFETNKKVNQGQAYRIIKKANLAPADVIKQENVLEDKKRMFGEAAFLTPGDLKRAAAEGEALPQNFPTQAPNDLEPVLPKHFKKDAYSQFEKFEAKQKKADSTNLDETK